MSESVGRFKMMYGRVRNDDSIAYGWFAAAWQLTGGGWHWFVRAPQELPRRSSPGSTGGRAAPAAVTR